MAPVHGPVPAPVPVPVPDRWTGTGAGTGRYMARPLPRAIEPPRASPSVSAQLLRRGLQHGGSDLGFARLFNRLNSGKPVRVLAFGTSVTGVAGGCTHSLLPYCEDCCGTRVYGPTTARRESGGFLRQAFDWINATWPHGEHRLYNSGRPGAGGLGNFVGCLSSWVPEAIDLFLLEVGGTGSTNGAIERLARDIYRLRGPQQMPAIAIYDVWNFRWPGALPAARGRPRSNAQFHSSGAARPPPHDDFLRPPLALPMARYYGWPVVSEHDGLYFELIEGRTGLSSSSPESPESPREARAAARARPPWVVLKPDLVHPTAEAAKLYGDLIVMMLYQSYEVWRMLGPYEAASVRAALLASRLPPPLVYHAIGSSRRPSALTRPALPPCDPDKPLATSFAQVDARDPLHALPRAAVLPFAQCERAWRKRGCCTPRPLYARHHRRVDAFGRPRRLACCADDAQVSIACFTFDKDRLDGHPRLSGPDAHIVDAEGGLAPNIISRRGWQFVRKVASSARANKPGLQATTAGALVELRVWPLEWNIAGKGVSRPAQVTDLRAITLTLRYLVSYERQGIAVITCKDGCTCATQRLDAHRPVVRESVDYMHEFNATLTQRSCVLCVEVAADSTSGGHEFKITRLVVHAPRHMPFHTRSSS